MTIVKKNLEFEWLGFKYILVSEFKLMSTTQVMQTMCENSSLVELYPTISKLACIALTIPVSTADVERGFSTMNRIKTEPRNRLNTETLDRLIRLSCEGPCIDEFNYNTAAKVWSSKSNRRIFD